LLGLWSTKTREEVSEARAAGRWKRESERKKKKEKKKVGVEEISETFYKIFAGASVLRSLTN